MYRYGYAGLCAALIAVGLVGDAAGQDSTVHDESALPEGFILDKQELPEGFTLDETNPLIEAQELQERLRRKQLDRVVEKAEAENKIGRYQIVPMGTAPNVWIFDTITGLIRICGPHLSDPSDPVGQAIITCSRWKAAGR